MAKLKFDYTLCNWFANEWQTNIGMRYVNRSWSVYLLLAHPLSNRMYVILFIVY